MLASFIAALILAHAPLSDGELLTCLGASNVAMNRVTVAQQRASLSDQAWTEACRAARRANERRLELSSAVLAGSQSPEPYASAAKFARAARGAKTPEHAALFEHVARDQVARAALSKEAKALYAPQLSPPAEMLLNGLISAEAVVADRRNQAWLAGVLRERGWFTISRDGAEADAAAWLIAQHSDADREFQSLLIRVLEPLAAAGETSASRFAFLHDRWASGVGAPLRYAIVGRCVAAGRWEPLNTEDLSGVDQRRQAAGLPPLAEWALTQSTGCRERP
jgi:hypothetical protein